MALKNDPEEKKENIKMQENQKETKKIQKAVETNTAVGYMKIDELLDKHLDKVKDLPKFPVKLIRTFDKKKRERVSIQLQIHPVHYKALVIQDGNEYITPEKFNALALALNLDYKDKKGRDVSEWNFNAPVRFITGPYANSDDKYQAVQVIFGKEDFYTHFLTNDQKKLISRLESKNLVTIDWIESPEKVERIDINDLTIE